MSTILTILGIANVAGWYFYLIGYSIKHGSAASPALIRHMVIWFLITQLLGSMLLVVANTH